MAFPVGYRLIGGMYYKVGDRSGPYVIDSAGNATLFNSGGGGIVTPTLQRVTPSDGDTVTLVQSDPVVTLLIEGSAALNSLTLRLPQPGASSPGQIVRIVSWVDIASVNYDGAAVSGASTQYFAGDGISLQNIMNNQWLELP